MANLARAAERLVFTTVVVADDTGELAEKSGILTFIVGDELSRLTDITAVDQEMARAMGEIDQILDTKVERHGTHCAVAMQIKSGKSGRLLSSHLKESPCTLSAMEETLRVAVRAVIAELSLKKTRDVPANATAALVVHVTPDDALVLVDGRPAMVVGGVAKIGPLTPGTYEVEVRHVDYRPRTQTVELSDGAHSELRLSLKGKPATIELVSDPDGASVAINGKRFSGQTPRSVTLEPGNYAVIFEKEDYFSTTREFTAEPNGRHTVSAELKALPSGSRKAVLYGGFGLSAASGIVAAVGSYLAYSSRSEYGKRGQSQDYYDDAMARVENNNRVVLIGVGGLAAGGLVAGVTWAFD